MYLIGDNVESARLMGVNVDLTKIITFAVVGFAAAFAGFVVSEEVLYFWPTLGGGYLLNTLASVFLGGTSVFGGMGTIFGTFVGVLHHRIHQRGHRGGEPDRVLDPADLRPDHRRLGCAADRAGEEVPVGASANLVLHPDRSLCLEGGHRMKNLKVAVKIGAGFGLVIAIAAGLGAVQFWNMMGVQGEANRLDKEIVPQVAVANDLERSVHRTMYSMQAFLQSMDSDALDQAKQFLSDTQKYLADADALAAKYPRLVVLRKNVAEAKTRVDEYTKLVDDTVSVNASITVERMSQVLLRNHFQYDRSKLYPEKDRRPERADQPSCVHGES